jgi:enoyl-CoA hydratase/carnithine racemase
VVGISQALEWSFSGRVFPAAEALAGGLVSRVVPDDQLLSTARAVAAEVADNTSAVSVALTRHLMWKLLGADHPMEAHRLDSRAIQALGRGADAAEGVTSFLEKRPPRFTLGPAADMPDFFPWWDEPEFS